MSGDLERTLRPAVWKDVPDVQWDDWRWQLSHRLNTVDETGASHSVARRRNRRLNANNLFRVDITPYFASLMDPSDPSDPIRLQVIPTAKEMMPFESMMEDSLAEDRHSPVPGLVHRYPDRVLMLVTTQCASYCRYCTRSRIVGDASRSFPRATMTRRLITSRARRKSATCCFLAAIRSRCLPKCWRTCSRDSGTSPCRDRSHRFARAGVHATARDG